MFRPAVFSLLATLVVSPPALAGKADDTLNVGFTDEAATLDAYKVSGRNGLIIARHLFDNLLYKNFDTGEFEPALAESYEFVDDTTLEFQLREGITFHNGEPFDADDVVYTLNTVSDPDYGTVYQISVDWIESVEKLGPHQVRLTLKEPYPLALEMLAGNLPIYPDEYFAEQGSDGMGVAPIGTGPYKLVDITPGTRWVLERFEDYYPDSPKGQPAIGNIVMRVLPERNTQYAELLTGQLDWIWKFPPDQAMQIQGRNGIQVESAPIMRIGYIHFNVDGDPIEYPVNNAMVRQAISHAINREAIMEAFVGESSQVVHTACNPAQFGCTQEVTKYEYNPEKARELLAEAGYPEGFDTELVVAASPRAQAEAIVADLAEVGIRATINVQQYASAREKWRAGEAPMTFSNWGSYGIGDMGLITSNFFGGGEDDLAQDREVIQWLEVGDTSIDPAVREEHYAKALKKIADNAYWLGLWTFNVNYAMSPDLEFSLDPDEFARFFQARWKE